MINRIQFKNILLKESRKIGMSFHEVVLTDNWKDNFLVIGIYAWIENNNYKENWIYHEEYEKLLLESIPINIKSEIKELNLIRDPNLFKKDRDVEVLCIWRPNTEDPQEDKIYKDLVKNKEIISCKEFSDIGKKKEMKKYWYSWIPGKIIKEPDTTIEEVEDNEIEIILERDILLDNNLKSTVIAGTPHKININDWNLRLG